MPKLEYDGIIARPGTYRRKNGTTIIKTWEELKKAFSRTHELKLTLGHPLTPDKKHRPVYFRDFLGRVLPIINEKKQVIEGLFQFYNEPWEKIPEHIRNRIVNDEAIEISVGYTSETDTQGVQTGMLHDHVALLADGENPICPLDQCGINVSVESDDGVENIMTYEEASSTRDEDKEPVKEEAAVEQVAGSSVISFSEEQFKELISTLKPPEQPIAEADAKPLEEEESEPQVEEPEKEPPQEPSLEPERAFPAGKPSKGKSPYLKDDGSVEVPSDIYLGGTKKEQ